MPHLQLPALELLAIELRRRPLRVLMQRKVHKAEAFVLGRPLALHKEGLLHGPNVGEELRECIVIRVEADAPHEDGAFVVLPLRHHSYSACMRLPGASSS